MPASAYGDLQRVRPDEVKGLPHVAGIEATHDHCRPMVDQRVEAAARRIESFVCGGKHGAAKRSPQLGQAFTGAGRTGHSCGPLPSPGLAPGVRT